eukprot:CAMPEP_0171289390 /NCGR_PEP_ID=MMETSP0790-20130122/70579_1 /TAXON_ID=2925 /ORGANISM="Alexandrium catenella, Strain OF101" /LENGTH=531 /DNA_ID=CAMNT_0011759015 /DNA_START=90 /DNA_END=1685 /DNA_ORIENTATION=-
MDEAVDCNQVQPQAGPSAELQSRLLQALREDHRAAIIWLQQHHVALINTVEHTFQELNADLLSSEPPGNTVVNEAPSSSPQPEDEATVVGNILDGKRESSAFASEQAKDWWMKRGLPSPHSFKNRFVDRLTKEDEQACAIKPGTLRQRVLRIESTAAFDSFIGLLIILNTVLMFVQLEIEAPDPSVFTETEAEGPYHLFFEVSAYIFAGIFFVELLVRLYAKRILFFLAPLNWVDAAIVIVTSIDAVVPSTLHGDRNIAFMRLLRFTRVVRAVRVIRTMSLFSRLRVLLNTIAMSFMSLFWSMLILFISMLMFSLFLCQGLQAFVAEPTNDPTTRDWVHRYYGSSSRALLTVFEVTFSGGWPHYARPLIEDVSGYWSIPFVMYITAVVFAMVRIISALFLKEKMKDVKAFVNKLTELFEQADLSKDGYLSREELTNIMSFPKVRVWMSVLGLDVTEANALFNLLDDGDGLISFEGFVTGIMRLKGTSRSQDTITIMKDCQRIHKQGEYTQRVCERLHEALGVQMQAPPRKR